MSVKTSVSIGLNVIHQPRANLRISAPALPNESAVFSTAPSATDWAASPILPVTPDITSPAVSPHVLTSAPTAPASQPATAPAVLPSILAQSRAPVIVPVTVSRVLFSDSPSVSVDSPSVGAASWLVGAGELSCAAAG
uniref:Uncharacterized protein n=1 Tax=Rhodococcus hoagii TaxID=43767 RepID=Q9ETD0_RHOHA|nr:unknown [Prescottella equi]BAB16650.1 hypothetical protein [Prescottella equi]